MKNAKRHLTDSELDQLFRDAHAVEGTEPLFVPEFWSEMEAMMPPVAKKRILSPWISFAAMLGLVFFLVYYPSNNSTIEPFNQHPSPTNGSNEKLVTPVQSGTELISGVEIPMQKGFHVASSTSNSENKTGVRKNSIKTTIKNKNTSESSDFALFDMHQEKAENPFNDSLELNKLVSNQIDMDFEKLSVVGLQGNTSGIKVTKSTPEADSPSNPTNWYIELGPTLGQSPYLSSDKKRNLVGGAVLGGGYIVQLDKTFISFGLQARIEGFGGLNYQESNFSPEIVRKVSVKQLYSIDLPIRFGYQIGRSEIAFGVVPGIQLFMHGKEQISENQVVTRTQNYTGKVQHSSTLSMEFGFQYYYRFAPKYSIGATINADILRPFHTDYYLGKVAGLPMNGQIVLRHTFGK